MTYTTRDKITIAVWSIAGLGFALSPALILLDPGPTSTTPPIPPRSTTPPVVAPTLAPEDDSDENDTLEWSIRGEVHDPAREMLDLAIKEHGEVLSEFLDLEAARSKADEALSDAYRLFEMRNAAPDRSPEKMHYHRECIRAAKRSLRASAEWRRAMAGVR